MMRLMLMLLLVQTVLVSTVVSVSAATTTTTTTTTTDPQNIHAVLVSSSRYWFNYRHANNILAMYQRLRQNGVPSSNIVMMMADEIPSNARNPFKNGMYDQGIHRPSLYNLDSSIAYRGADVTVANFMNVLLGTVHTMSESSSRVLHTNSSSNIMIYVTGHGGDQFFKFQDEEELMAQDIASGLDQLHLRQKYNQVLFLADTCQAFTLSDKITAPNVYALGTSLRGENAYAHHSDRDVGLSVIERWTYQMLKAYDQKAHGASTLQDILIDTLEPTLQTLGAHLGVRDDLGVRTFDQVLLSEFFGEKDYGVNAMAGNSKTKTMTAPSLQVGPTATLGTIMHPPISRSRYEKEETRTMAASSDDSSNNNNDAIVLEPLSQEFGMLVAGLLVLVLLTSLVSTKRPSSETTVLLKVTKEKKL
jgi:phosphatidylinositol glycan class K